MRGQPRCVINDLVANGPPDVRDSKHCGRLSAVRSLAHHGHPVLVSVNKAYCEHCFALRKGMVMTQTTANCSLMCRKA